MQKKGISCVGVKCGVRNVMNTKICQRNPSKTETKRALLNILATEDSYIRV